MTEDEIIAALADAGQPIDEGLIAAATDHADALDPEGLKALCRRAASEAPGARVAALSHELSRQPRYMEAVFRLHGRRVAATSCMLCIADPP